jgi:hypothetical protein
MSVTKHIPDLSPGPTESACREYPLGVWPALTSAFCANPSLANPRHPDCSLPGCTCRCHTAKTLQQEEKAKGSTIAESKLERDKLWQGIHSSTRIPPRK